MVFLGCDCEDAGEEREDAEEDKEEDKRLGTGGGGGRDLAVRFGEFEGTVGDCGWFLWFIGFGMF